MWFILITLSLFRPQNMDEHHAFITFYYISFAKRSWRRRRRRRGEKRTSVHSLYGVFIAWLVKWCSRACVFDYDTSYARIRFLSDVPHFPRQWKCVRALAITTTTVSRVELLSKFYNNYINMAHHRTWDGMAQTIIINKDWYFIFFIFLCLIFGCENCVYK